MTDWNTHEIQQLNGQAERIKLSGKFQILSENWIGRWTEEWNQVAAVPYIVYFPEKDRVLMMVSCGNPHQTVILTSDDHGATWSEPWYVHTDENGKSDTGLGVGLVYLGNGKVILRVDKYWLGEREFLQWCSEDYGNTWSKGLPFSTLTVHAWNPPMVDTDPKTGEVTRVWETAYAGERIKDVDPPKYWIQAYLRQSTDEGQTWTEWVKVPEWEGFTEVALIRANNGNMVAAGRTNIPEKLAGENDNYAGLGVSISSDNGCTWSKMKFLYEWGRHHQSMVLLPDGDIVMTYVARAGYVKTPEGYPQFGVEAVVSHDNGRTWDLDHRYLLAAWSGNRTDPEWSWARGSQQTSSVLLPDGSILTAFGTGYRGDVPEGKEQNFNPRDVGLVNWCVNNEGLSDDKTITDALIDSEQRNCFDPHLDRL